MKMRTLGSLIAFSAMASPFLSSCAQPQIVCTAAPASAAGQLSTYTLKGAAPACAATTEHPSGVTLDKLKYEIIGFATYHPDLNPDKPGLGAPDFSKGSVAWQSDALGQLIGNQGTDPNADHKPYAIGDWTKIEPDENGICEVSNIKPAEQSVPKVEAVAPDPMDPDDKGSPELPPVDVKYEWSNFKIYVTAAAQGTQFSGDLTYTQDTCAVDYHVVGFWPAHDCTKVDPDTGKPVLDGEGKPQPDDANCCPNADPDVKRFAGSGINPDFPLKCDPVILTCVLDNPENKDIPVLSPDWSTKTSLCGKTATNQTR